MIYFLFLYLQFKHLNSSPYTYTYAVADDYSKSNFNAEETSDGASNVQGSYTVALPDGRIQKVTYSSNGYDGYVADVTYEGTAVYPEAPAPGYKAAPAPAYHAAPAHAPVAHAAPVVAHAVHAAPVVAHAVHAPVHAVYTRGGWVRRRILPSPSRPASWRHRT